MEKKTDVLVVVNGILMIDQIFTVHNVHCTIPTSLDETIMEHENQLLLSTLFYIRGISTALKQALVFKLALYTQLRSGVQNYPIFQASVNHRHS